MRIGALKTYVLLTQERAGATLYQRSGDWTAVQVAADCILPLDCVSLDLSMTWAYEGVGLSRKA